MTSCYKGKAKKPETEHLEVDLLLRAVKYYWNTTQNLDKI